jgi:DNA anti-recombination protein RmuC
MEMLQVAWWLLAGALAGGVVVWLLMRARQQSRVVEAVTQAQGLLQVDLARATMRADQAETTSKQTLSDLQELRQKAEGLRNDLDSARDQCASLGERASRIPIMEAEAKESRARRCS